MIACPLCLATGRLTNRLAPCGWLTCILCDGEGRITEAIAEQLEALTGTPQGQPTTKTLTLFTEDDWK